MKFDIPKTLPIKKIIRETDHVKTFVFEHSLGAGVAPGQFVNLWLPRLDEKPMSIAYSDEKEFWVTMFAVGPFSKAMHTLKEGDLVGVRGPYGKGFSYKKGWRLVMMGGGYGAAPLHFLTKRAIEDGCSVDFVVGARSKEHLLYLDHVKNLKNVTLHVATDDGSMGTKGYNTLILEKLIAESRDGGTPIDMVYACGPELMEKTISDICYEHGVDAQLSVERYMKCGFGVCGQCSVDGRGQRMCKEGPVISNKEARSIEEFGKYHRDAVGKVHEF